VESREEYEASSGQYQESGRETFRKSAAGATALAATAGIAAVVLSILGLVDIAPLYMAAISAILIGAGLLLEGGFTTAWFSTASPRREYSEGGLSAEFIGGVAAIVLGILALVGMNANVLLPIAVLALGVSLFMGAWVSAASGAKLFVGLSAIVLGILGLMGFVPMILTLVGFLSLGCGTLLSGTAFSAKFMSREHAHA